MFEIQKPYLQKIIGVDKNNPVFTLWRDPESSGGIQVYFATELMEVVPDDRNDPQFKLMIARLYLAGIKPKKLTGMFGPARTTITVSALRTSASFLERAWPWPLFLARCILRSSF